DEQVPEQYRFSPSMLIDMMTSKRIKLGLWIDLTNTSRFYPKSEVESQGIKYFKLQCRGHGECPDEGATRLFVEACKSFISHHPLEAIGVHCTHGFNRTGFLVCAYLVEVENWSIDAAIKLFAKCRKP